MSSSRPMRTQPVLSETEAALLFAHKTNIERYSRLLAGDLTDHERVFVRRRLNEELMALESFARVR